MTVLRDISLLWSIAHTLVMFLLLFESRFSKKATLVLTLSSMIPLIILNIIIFGIVGMDTFTKLMLATMSLPSFIFFFFLSKHRDARFIFTFCMVDTIVLEIIYITNIIDSLIPGYLFMFTSRLAVFPLLEWFIYRKFKTIYRDIQNEVRGGWGIFALIGVMFYVVITISMSTPTMITERPEYMPAFVILLILMPVSYINIFNTLRHQQSVFRSREQENILKVQVADIATRVEEVAAANDKFSKERHDFRHKLQTIAKLVESGKFDVLMSILSKYNDALDETKIKKYCDNAVLDAVLSSYIRRAERSGVEVTTAIDLPEELPVSDIELATALANAIENATFACEKLESSGRIEIKIISTPQFMLQIRNSFNGEIEFGEDGIPVSHEEGHGFGTRSIVAFCNKYDAFYEFFATEDEFTLRMMF